MFSTQNNGQDTVKTPIGMFADTMIPNDLLLVDTTIRAYYGLTQAEGKEDKKGKEKVDEKG
jgi:hypothetical protein